MKLQFFYNLTTILTINLASASTMTFKLTPEVVHSIFGPTAEGNWEPFQAAIAHDVKWQIADPVRDPKTFTGIYNLKEWQELVLGVLGPKLDPNTPLKMEVWSWDIIGDLKLVAEASSEASQKNGNPYRNRYAWFMTFSAETGKIIEVREYLNTALLLEVSETNP